MSSRVAVVTDSTASLPLDVLERFGIIVVPLSVVIGGQVFDDGSEATASDVATALRSWTPVSTSRPSPAALLAAYEKAQADGADAVVSIHLSAAMSGTFDSAVLAAKSAPLPVQAVDSRSLGMALGYSVVSAAAVAAESADLDAVVDAAVRRARATSSLFYVDTLEYLRRGGRIGAAQALIGSALAVKPLLHVKDGKIAPLEKVRTSSRALSRLEDLAVERAGAGPVDAAVHHLASSVRAEQLAAGLRARLRHLVQLSVSEVGAVVGAHVGPGMVAVVVAPRG
ncbi:MAG TPA: DegV family protein [Actinomycetes bacterium]|nr:DegV family protein [Actinomycetes bacterium]